MQYVVRVSGIDRFGQPYLRRDWCNSMKEALQSGQRLVEHFKAWGGTEIHCDIAPTESEKPMISTHLPRYICRSNRQEGGADADIVKPYRNRY